MYDMTVDDALEMFCFPDDILFSVYDMAEDVCDIIFTKGYKCDCPDQILNMTFYTFDNIYPDTALNYVVINVCSD